MRLENGGFQNGAKECRSRRELSNEYLLAKIGVDTAENEPLEVWGKIFTIIHWCPQAHWNEWTRDYQHMKDFGFADAVVVRYEDLVLDTDTQLAPTFLLTRSQNGFYSNSNFCC